MTGYQCRARSRPRDLLAFLLPLFSLIACGARTPPERVGIEEIDVRVRNLVPAGAVVETLATGFGWAEGPAWNAADGSLVFSDIPAGRVHRWSETGGVEMAFETRRPGATAGTPGSNGLAFDSAGRLLLAHHGERALLRREVDSTFTVLAGGFEGRRFNSPNDLAVARNGALYFTDPPYGLPKTFRDPGRQLDYCGVYRRAAQGDVTLLLRHLEAPNGVGLSPDERTLYVTDVTRGRGAVWAFPLAEDGTIAGDPASVARMIHDLSTSFGPKTVPDGLVVDPEGVLYVAGSAGVIVLWPDGTLLGRITTGDFATNVELGGGAPAAQGTPKIENGGAPAAQTSTPRRHDLYITTSRSLLRVRLSPH